MLCCLCFVLILHGAEVFSAHSELELELELILSQMAQKPMLRGEVGARMAPKFSQRTAAHSCFGTQLRKLLRHARCLGHSFGTQFLTRSVREMTDFLMSILPTPFCVHADKTSNFVGLLGELSKAKLYKNYAARQAEVARDYLKRATRIGELNGHPPGSDGPMATALKRYNGGRVLVPLHPAALASVPYGIVLVRVRVF